MCFFSLFLNQILGRPVIMSSNIQGYVATPFIWEAAVPKTDNMDKLLVSRF